MPVTPAWRLARPWVCVLARLLASALFPSAVAPALSFSQCLWPSDGCLAPCCVAPVPCSRGRVPVTLRLSSPPCRGPSLCPFPFRCPAGGVVARSVGGPWPMPGAERPGATSRGFRGCREGGGPEPRPGGGFPMPSAAWRPPGRCRRGRRESGRGFSRTCGGGGAPHAFLPPPQPTSPSGGTPAGRGGTPRRGWWGLGGGRAQSLRSWSGSGGGSS